MRPKPTKAMIAWQTEIKAVMVTCILAALNEAKNFYKAHPEVLNV
jgi:hypothetical protein